MSHEVLMDRDIPASPKLSQSVAIPPVIVELSISKACELGQEGWESMEVEIEED